MDFGKVMVGLGHSNLTPPFAYLWTYMFRLASNVVRKAGCRSVPFQMMKIVALKCDCIKGHHYMAHFTHMQLKGMCTLFHSGLLAWFPHPPPIHS